MILATIPTPTLDISAALKIPGWMSEKELLWLAELGSRSEFGVEIGTYLGRSARAIADNMPSGARLICIDPFSDSTGIEKSREDWARIERDCRENLSDLPSTRILIWKTDSIDAVRYRRWAYSRQWTEEIHLGRELDFVFIDGDHDYLSVRNDISAWLPLVREGGTICGHDFGVWPGVEIAVREVFGDGFEIVEGTSIWKVTKK